MEVLKHFTYEATIQSNRVTVSQFRAKAILHAIFDALTEDQRLLPDDARHLYERGGVLWADPPENPQTIFKPL